MPSVIRTLTKTLSALALVTASSISQAEVESQLLAQGLDHPWAIDWLSPHEALVTERSGQLWQIRLSDGERFAIDGLPPIQAEGQGGLLDVQIQTLDEVQWVYLSLVAPHPTGGLGTELWRGQLNDRRLVQKERLFQMNRGGSGGRHFGGRIALTEDYVFLTLGDRGTPDRSQDLADHAGSVIRLHLDGRIPDDNPFLTVEGALPELFSVGHRNPQGAAIHPSTGELWLHEHGPQGGDEVNRVMPGANYGWPVITYGRTYGLGRPIGEGTKKPGLEQPLLYWDPSIAPSGMAFYQGDLIPEWQGQLFIGALKARLLARLDYTDRVRQLSQEFQGEFGRIRDVREGPDGALYLLTDSADGELIRLTAR